MSGILRNEIKNNNLTFLSFRKRAELEKSRHDAIVEMLVGKLKFIGNLALHVNCSDDQSRLQETTGLQWADNQDHGQSHDPTGLDLESVKCKWGGWLRLIMVKVKLFNQIFFHFFCISGRPPRPKLYGFAHRAQGQHPQGYGEGSFF